MKMGHVIKADLSRFKLGSDPRTVNTQIVWTVPTHHSKPQIRLVKPAEILNVASTSSLFRDVLSHWSFYRLNQDSQARNPPPPPHFYPQRGESHHAREQHRPSVFPKPPRWI